LAGRCGSCDLVFGASAMAGYPSSYSTMLYPPTSPTAALTSPTAALSPTARLAGSARAYSLSPTPAERAGSPYVDLGSRSPYAAAQGKSPYTASPWSPGSATYTPSPKAIPNIHRPPTFDVQSPIKSPHHAGANKYTSYINDSYSLPGRGQRTDYGGARGGAPSPYGGDYSDILSSPRHARPTLPAPGLTSTPNIPAVPPTSPRGFGIAPPQSAADQGKYSLVFDLDETLVYARSGSVQPRPGSSEILRNLGSSCELLVWTSSEKSYAANAIQRIDHGRTIRHTVARDTGGWFSGDRTCAKNLRMLGRDLSKTLLIENTPDCIAQNTDNAILLPDFTGGADPGVLSSLQNVLNDLNRSGKSVPEFLSTCKQLTKRTVRANSGANVNCWTLAAHDPTVPPTPPTATSPIPTSYYSAGAGYGKYGKYSGAPKTYLPAPYSSPRYGATY